MTDKFIYFECGECGFSSVQKADFDGSEECPMCLGDSGHTVKMSKREARDTDKPEGRDARKGEADFRIVTSSSNNDIRRLFPDAPKEAVVKDPISKTPDISGAHGKAWLCDMNALRKRVGGNRNDATLAHWVIEAPWAHPIWSSYSIVLIHLRQFPDAPEPIIYMPDATHELWVYAISDEVDRLPVIEGNAIRGLWLSPKQFGAQFIEISDELAMDRIKATVQLIVDGKLSPDVDAQKDWIALYGNNMIKKEFR